MSEYASGEPDVSEVEGSETPSYPSVSVTIETPVRTQELPAAAGDMRSRDDITTTPAKLFDADPRRKRLVLIANTAPIVISRTQQECVNGRGAHIPTGTSIELTHREPVWVASESGVQTVSWVHELWTD